MTEKKEQEDSPSKSKSNIDKGSISIDAPIVSPELSKTHISINDDGTSYSAELNKSVQKLLLTSASMPSDAPILSVNEYIPSVSFLKNKIAQIIDSQTLLMNEGNANWDKKKLNKHLAANQHFCNISTLLSDIHKCTDNLFAKTRGRIQFRIQFCSGRNTNINLCRNRYIQKYHQGTILSCLYFQE